MIPNNGLFVLAAFPNDFEGQKKIQCHREKTHNIIITALSYKCLCIVWNKQIYCKIT